MKKLMITSLLVISLGLLVACQSGAFFVTITPLPQQTASATCVWPCPGDSLTLTASAGQTLFPPSSTAPANVTIIPAAGDLGWGVIYGRLTDRVTGQPIENAKIRCAHVSDRSPANVLSSGVTWTNADGLYAFSPAFFRDTDVITFTIEAPGYKRIETRLSFFAINALKTDFTLEPDTADSISPTPTFIIMCTAPACSSDQGALACGDPNGCPGGCGTVCRAFTPTPTLMLMCTAPACSNGVLTCGNLTGCSGGCGTVCNAFTPAP